MPFGPWANWDACMAEMRKKYAEETAKKVCGKLKAELEKKDFIDAKDFVNAECVQARMQTLRNNGSAHKNIKEILYESYDFCKSKTDFDALDLRSYEMLRNISVLLAENDMDSYIINDSAVMSQVGFGGSEFRVEPMKTLAEASTGGAKKSENIEKVGYFNSMLEVEFGSGERYIYFVGPKFYDEFVASASKGKFLWEQLRGKKPGLVWPGTDLNRKTPGGVGGALVPYARGSAGTPEYEAKVPEGTERELTHKEVALAFRREGLKYKEQDEGLKRKETLTELRHIFKSRGIDFDDKNNEMQDWVDELYDFMEIIGDIQNKEGEEGHWITMRGTHVFIKKGVSKAEQIKAWIKAKEKGLSKEEKEEKREKFYEKLKEGSLEGKKRKKKEERETKKKAKEEELKNKQDERERKKIENIKHKKEPELSEREKGVQKLIEKRGYDRERAEEEYNKKHPDPKKLEKQEKTKEKIKKKEKAIQKRVEKLKGLNKNYKSTIIRDIILFLNDMLKQSQKGNNPNMTIPFKRFYSQLRDNKKLTDTQKLKVAKEIEKLDEELWRLRGADEDFENNCDYNQNGKCIDERNENYLKLCSYENQDKCPTADFDTSISGKWITTRTGNKIYLYDNPTNDEEWLKEIKRRDRLSKIGENVNPGNYINQKMPEIEKEAYQMYLDYKFHTKRNSKIMLTMSDKIVVSRAIDVDNLSPGSVSMWRLFDIDDAFKSLPQKVQDSISELRIFPNADDDKILGEKDSSCAGFWGPWRKSVTIGMYKFFISSESEYNSIESLEWLTEVLIHEGAHALDDTKLTAKERKLKEELYKKYKGRLTRHYAGKNKDEFFAEAYAYNMLLRRGMNPPEERHPRLWERAEDINVFINSIVDKYDFSEDITNIIQYSYTNEQGIHVFGRKRIPEDISAEEAERMVQEQKAKYIEVKESSEVDFIVDDSFDELMEWVRKNTDAEDEDEVKAIAFAIINKKKKAKKERDKEASKREYDEEIEGKKQEMEWRNSWKKISPEFEKLRKNRTRYKEYIKGQNAKIQRSLYSSYDMGIPIREDFCGSVLDFGVCDKRYELLYDFYHTENDTLKNDLQEKIDNHQVNVMNDTVMHGVLTRAGPFKYGDQILYKEWNNITENAEETMVLPVFGSREYGSHKEKEERLIGYADNFIPNHKTEELEFDWYSFDPIEKLSDLRDPHDLNVSLSFYDDRKPDSNIQKITGFRHVAVSLNNLEKDRCSSIEGMGRCTASPASGGAQIVTQLNINKKSGVRDTNDRHHVKERLLLGSDGTGDFLEASASDLLKIKMERPNMSNEKIEQIIKQVLNDFKTTDDSSLVTGDEVKGHTNKDIFMNQCLKHKNSPEQCAKAWTQYNQKKPEETKTVDPATAGHQKTPAAELSKDFEDRIGKLEAVIKKQEVTVKKYEDFFQAKQNEEEQVIKDKLKLIVKEEKHDFIDSKTGDELKALEEFYDDLIEEHPEILPTTDTASQIQDMNTNEILKMMGRTKKDLRQTQDDLEKIKAESEKAMEERWSTPQKVG